MGPEFVVGNLTPRVVGSKRGILELCNPVPGSPRAHVAMVVQRGAYAGANTS